MTTITHPTPIRLIYIAGYGRSGSTLLDIALGGHPSVFGSGEVGELTRHVWAENEYCACGCRVRDCAFWSRVVGSWTGSRNGVIGEYVKDQLASESIFSFRRILRPRRNPFSSLTRELFEQISLTAGRPVLLDSNKIPGRGFALAAMPGIDLYVVHLVRDPRAVVWSMLKPLKRQVEAGVQKDLKPKPLLRTALRWLIVNLASEILVMRVGRRRSVRVRYEDFTTDPRASLAHVLALVGESADSIPGDARAPLRPHHQVSGSRHRMQKELLIRTEDCWRTSMPLIKQRVTALTCAPLIWRYGYPLRTRARRLATGARLSRLGGVPATFLFAAALSMTFVFAGCSSQAGTNPAAPPPPRPVTGQLAFPGAIGHGAGTRGGRGGRVIIVNSLEDSGPGTLRTCFEAQGPRVCVFRIAGVIRFESPAIINNPYLTIAGQTAPGGGITLAHVAGPAGRTPLVIKGTHDIIVQDIRVRNDTIGGSRGSEDSITIERSDNVIVDHVSASWARDELINGYGNNGRITVSNSIFAQGIPRHDKCALLASDPVGPQRFSFIGNLCAHNGDRNPDIKFPPGSCAEVVNNVLYNAQSQFTEIWENFGGTPISVVGNVYRAGPNTHGQTQGIARNIIGSKGQAAIYLWDNRFDGNFVHMAPSVEPALVRQPQCPLTVRPLSANQAYISVLRYAGAWPRDDFDTMIVRETERQNGSILKSGEPGLIPPIDPGINYQDQDSDGMDDGWEGAHGASARRYDPWGDGNRNGIANLDEFLADRLKSLLGRP